MPDNPSANRLDFLSIYPATTQSIDLLLFTKSRWVCIRTSLLSDSDGLTFPKAETQTHDLHDRGRTVKFNGVNGQYGKSASLWLAELNCHRDEESTPSMHLLKIIRHLEGEAALWALNSKIVVALVCAANDERATDADVDVLQGALTKRFRLTDDEGQALIRTSPLAQFLTLSQETGEDLEDYYRRARDLLHGRYTENITLTPLEISYRAMIVMRFGKGLSREGLWVRLLLQSISHPTVSLHHAFIMAKMESKVMDMERRADTYVENEQEKEQGDEQQQMGDHERREEQWPMDEQQQGQGQRQMEDKQQIEEPRQMNKQQQTEEQEQGKEDEQRREPDAKKRKHGTTDEKKPTNTKKQKQHATLIVHLPTRFVTDGASSPQGDQSEEPSDSSKEEISDSSEDDTSSLPSLSSNHSDDDSSSFSSSSDTSSGTSSTDDDDSDYVAVKSRPVPSRNWTQKSSDLRSKNTSNNNKNKNENTSSSKKRAPPVAKMLGPKFLQEMNSRLQSMRQRMEVCLNKPKSQRRLPSRNK